MFRLYIANKNYSSWSLRPWVLMRELAIPFEERLLVFGDTASWAAYRTISPSGKVPCLQDAETSVWDSYAITEFLGEQYPSVWPESRLARAWARSAAAEMHSGFNELRNQCSMSCGVRISLKTLSPGLVSDLKRLGALWNDGLQRFGGPYLAGPGFTAVDAFFAPVAFRVQTYGLRLESAAAAYARRLLDLKSMQAWYSDALAETFRDHAHEIEIADVGTVTLDLRAT
jgi:glutathione S-transferase